MGDEQKDIQALKLQTLEKELEKLGLELKEFKKEHRNDSKILNDKIQVVEDKYNKLELLIAEIKRDISYSTAQLSDIKELTNQQIKEQRDFQNKAFIYLLITLCTGLLFLLGVNVADIPKLFGL